MMYLFLNNEFQVIILESILGSISPDVHVPDILNIKEKLMYTSLMSSHELSRLSSSRLLASFVNKLKDPMASELMLSITDEIFKKLATPLEASLKYNFAVLFSWLVKGLVLKGDPSVDGYISQWFNLLGKEDIGRMMAEVFRTLFEEDRLYLNLNSHCNYRYIFLLKVLLLILVYGAQKFYTYSEFYG